jgi:ammonia channel protein AmtB
VETAFLAAGKAPALDTGDIAWLLATTALVLLMTPGLALFYGGMVRTKSVLNMLMMSFVSIALVTVMGLRASEEQEHTGLDLTVHAETAYDHGVLGHGAPVAHSVPAATQKVDSQA